MGTTPAPPPLALPAVPLLPLLPLLVLGLGAGEAVAHPLDPCLLELRELGGGRVEALWREPAAAPRGARLEPILPAGCRQLAPAAAIRGENRIGLRWQAECPPLPGLEVAVEGLRERGTDALVRILFADGRVAQAVLRGDASRYRIPAQPAAAAVLREYLAFGCDHILSGLDHLLFVLGLLFLVRGRRALLLTVSAFTLGHSVTLSLAALGLLRLPPAPVEALIALSIFVLALRLAGRAPREGSDGSAPWPMAALFGLLHGLGFAGALAEAGLPPGEVPLALFSFNLGIEAGQLAFIGGVLLLFALLRRLPLPGGERDPAERLALPAAYLIGPLAFYWLLERAVALAAQPPGLP